MQRSRGVFLALSLCFSTPALAQSFTNGSLTGPIANAGLPSGWTNLLGSPDTNSEFNNVGSSTPFGATPSTSPNGGTWVGLGREGTGFIERFAQSVSGFTVGQSYTISWYASNFGAITGESPGYIGANQIEVRLGGVSLGFGALLPMAQGWFSQSLTFTSSAAVQQIEFQLGSNTRAYMGIDGLALSPTTTVPEPATFALLATGLGVLGLAARRRRA